MSATEEDSMNDSNTSKKYHIRRDEEGNQIMYIPFWENSQHQKYEQIIHERDEQIRHLHSKIAHLQHHLEEYDRSFTVLEEALHEATTREVSAQQELSQMKSQISYSRTEIETQRQQIEKRIKEMAVEKITYSQNSKLLKEQNQRLRYKLSQMSQQPSEPEKPINQAKQSRSEEEYQQLLAQNSQTQSQLRKALKDINSLREQYTVQLDEEKQKASQNQLTISKLKKTIKDLQRKAKEEQENFQESEKKTQAEVEKLKAKNKALSNQLQTLKAEAESNHEQLNQLRPKLDRQKSKISDLQAQKAVNQEEKQALNKNIQQLRNQIEKLKQNQIELTREKSELEEKIQQFQRKLSRAEAQNTGNKEALNSGYEELEQRCQSLEKKLLSTEKEKSKLITEHCQQVDDLTRQISQLKSEIQRLQQKVVIPAQSLNQGEESEKDRQISRLRNQLKEQSRAARTKQENLLEEIQVLKAELLKLKTQRSQLLQSKESNDSSWSLIQSKQQQITELRQKISALEEQCRRAKNETDKLAHKKCTNCLNLTKKLQAFLEKEREFEEKVSGLEAQIEKADEEYRALQKQKEKLQKQINSLKKENKNLQNSQNSLKQHQTQLQEEKENLQNEVQTLRDENQKLKAKIEDLSRKSSDNKESNKVLKAKDNEIKKLSQRIKELEDQIEKLTENEQENIDEREDDSSAVAQVTELKRQAVKHSKKIKQLQNENTKLKKKVTGLETELQELKNLSEPQLNPDESKQLKEKFDKEREKLHKKISTLEKEISALKADKQNMSRAVPASTAKIDASQKQYEMTYQNELQRLRRLIIFNKYKEQSSAPLSSESIIRPSPQIFSYEYQSDIQRVLEEFEAIKMQNQRLKSQLLIRSDQRFALEQHCQACQVLRNELSSLMTKIQSLEDDLEFERNEVDQLRNLNSEYLVELEKADSICSEYGRQSHQTVHLQIEVLQKEISELKIYNSELERELRQLNHFWEAKLVSKEEEVKLLLLRLENSAYNDSQKSSLHSSLYYADRSPAVKKSKSKSQVMPNRRPSLAEKSHDLQQQSKLSDTLKNSNLRSLYGRKSKAHQFYKLEGQI